VLEILLRRSGKRGAQSRLFEDHLFGALGAMSARNAVEVYVHRLRKMLADAGAHGEDPYGGAVSAI